MKYHQIKSELFIENRKRFNEKLKPKSLAIIHSNDEFPRSGDQNYIFHQNPDMFWLTGIDQEESIFISFPDSPIPAYREVLFLKKTNEHIAIWEGHKYTKEEAFQTSGIRSVFWLDDYKNIFPMLMHHCEHVYINSNENDRYVHINEYRDIRFAKQLMEQYPLHRYERAAPIFRELRAVKTSYEVELLQTACDITEKAFRRILPFVKPGIMEYEIEAEIIHEFIRNRATGHAYTPIIASGESAIVLHYTENNKICNDSDVLLLDFGAEYANYNADLSRSIPVNGKFTSRQKDVYNSVLHVFKEARKMLIEGTILDDYHKEVGKIMESELIKLKLLDKQDVSKQNPDMPLYKKYFMHGTSHFLGLDVHDIGNRYEKMKAGMVFTCEPGIYIPEEKLGIRIENDILITKNGNIDLMQNIPIEADEIESLMN